MTHSSNCPRCGGPLPANFPPGVCPACLMQQGLSPSTHGEFPSSGSGRARSNRMWIPPSPAELAPRFPQLDIVELLGHGGMGAVYKVRQKDLDRWAALKILPDEVAIDPSFAERFQREARALAQLGHPHIVTVYEFGQRDGVYFLLMEYVDGVTLRQASRSGQVTAQDALGIVTQICDALQFAHEEGVVHRDIKPENILIDRRGRVKIADFGLAKLFGKTTDVPSLTGTQQVMGTPVYMAPEQMEGTKGVDHRADIFSLGVVFYELLTGELPLGRFAPPSQKYSLDVRLDEVVLRTLEKEPDRRYQQASQVKGDVETIRNHPAPTKSASPAPSHRWPRTKAGQATLIVLVCMALFCLFVPGLRRTIWNLSEFAADRFTKPAPEVARKQDAIQQYMHNLELQRLEKLQQQDLEEAASDPNIVQFTPEGVKLHRRAFGTALTAEQRSRLEKMLTDVHGKYIAVEAQHLVHTFNEDGSQTVSIDLFTQEVDQVEHALWTAIDTQLPVSQQKLLRQQLPLYADPGVEMPQVQPEFLKDPMGTTLGSRSPFVNTFPANMRNPQVLGWRQHQFPLRISLSRKGKWFAWNIETMVPGPGQSFSFGAGGASAFTRVDSDEAPELPSGLRRFWRERGPTPMLPSGFNPIVGANEDPEAHVANPDLKTELLKMDALRAGDATPWHKVEQSVAYLLMHFPTPQEKGQIYWMAAHVYGQSDIRGHAADVIRHAQEALKYERDPIQRGWLFMYLGNANDLLDANAKNYVNRREISTRWYLKGFQELLPYNLPDEAPELPIVGKFGRGRVDDGGHPDDTERVAAEVLQAAQIKVRQEAEFIRELVHRRAVYIQSLQENYGRLHSLYDKESDAKARLREIATEVFRDQAYPDGMPVVEDLLNRVFPTVTNPKDDRLDNNPNQE